MHQFLFWIYLCFRLVVNFDLESLKNESIYQENTNSDTDNEHNH